MKILLDDFDSKRLERLNATIETNSAMADALLSFVNVNPRYVTIKQINEFVEEYEMLPELAYAMIVSTAMGLDIHKNNIHNELFQDYLEPGFHCLNPKDFADDRYMKTIKINNVKVGNLELKMMSFLPAEALIFDDCTTSSEFREVQQIGFFINEFSYPAIVENGKIISSLDPLTINTNQTALENAHGNVLCLGLGMGYFACLSAEKKSVDKITVLEKNADIIDIFKSGILPQISSCQKIEIINADPLEYIEKPGKPLPYDFIFSDTSDLKTYLRLREYGCGFARERKFLSEVRRLVFNRLYSIFKNPADGGKEIRSYREFTEMISDKELKTMKTLPPLSAKYR